MIDLTSWQLCILFVAAAFAGFVDSIAGGGGIITVPALLAVGFPPHLALSTVNNCSAKPTLHTANHHPRPLDTAHRRQTDES